MITKGRLCATAAVSAMTLATLAGPPAAMADTNPPAGVPPTISADALPTRSVPLLMLVVPEYVFAPVSDKVPPPVFAKANVPAVF